ncbi:MAG: phosphatase PAP2 family protein [Lachnospiraceae bacterium]|nr:phosphatase PAP2 family protein [Lachnospiraceae bacterium]
MRLGKKFTIIGIGLMAAAILFTVMVATIDVRPIGPNGSSVGLAGLNSAFADAFGINKVLYVISEVCGYPAIIVALAFVALGAYELVKRKNIFKVDYCILSMGVLFVVVMILYILFDKMPINYRPILESDGTLESSFPSSHTLLAVCILIPAIFSVGRIIKDKKIAFIITSVLAFLAVVVVICRLFSGVHWLTDMIGGVFYSLALVCVYIGANLLYENK